MKKKCQSGGEKRGKSGSRPISRVLSRTIIHLGPMSPPASSNLPGSCAGHTSQPKLLASLFGLAPGGVYLAAECCHPRGALLPHPFSLTGIRRCLGGLLSVALSVGSRPPRRYLAPCPAEPGLSSADMLQRLPGRLLAHTLVKKAGKLKTLWRADALAGDQGASSAEPDAPCLESLRRMARAYT